MKIKYFLGVAMILVIVFLGFAVNTKALTPEENQQLILQLQTQILQLQAQIQALIARQTISTGTADGWCHTFNKNLGFGNKTCAGESDIDTASLEMALVKQGLITQHSGDCVEYDTRIADAVVQFQAKYGIYQSGFVGKLTRAKLNTLYRCVVTPTPPQPECSVDADCPQPNCVSLNSTAIANCLGSVNRCISGECVMNVVPVPPACVPNWQCVWGTCTNGYQSQTARDLNNCGLREVTPIACTMLARACSSTPSAPAISSISPTSGVVGATVTVYGTGFTSTGNKIKFGSLGSENNPVYNVSSSNGTTLQFNVPTGNYLACWSTEPRCMAPMVYTQPGSYQISVINANGTSNTKSFSVTSSCTPTTTYGNWGVCTNGQQMRDVRQNYPTGCTVPANYQIQVETRPCSTNVCTVEPQCGTWSSCVNGSQTRACNTGCTSELHNETRVCSPVCSPTMNCEAWSACVSGSQTKSCVITGCPEDGGTPSSAYVQTQACSVGCTPVTTCGKWGACSRGWQSRQCTLGYPEECNLDTMTMVTTESQECNFQTCASPTTWRCTGITSGALPPEGLPTVCGCAQPVRLTNGYT